MKIIGKRFPATDGQGVIDTAKALQDEANRIVEHAGYKPIYETITVRKAAVNIPLVAVSLTHEPEAGIWHVICNNKEEADDIEYMVVEKLNLFNP
jgi:hypothetical protein